MRYSDIYAPLLEANGAEAWGQALNRQVARFGFGHVHFVVVPLAVTRIGDHSLSTTLPPHWREYFARQCMTGNDPAVSHCRTRTTPFAWAPDSFPTRRDKRVYTAAADAGLRIGVVLPIHGPCGATGMFALFSDRIASARNIDDIACHLPALALLRDGALGSVLSFGPVLPQAAPPTLTTREHECMQWLVAGKSSWDIAQILKVAETTVNFHMANVCKKLGAGSRLVAVARAVKLRLIEPD